MLKVQEIREIIRLIDESSIDEFTYEANGTKVKLKKNGNGTAVTKPILETSAAPAVTPATPEVVQTEQPVVHTESKVEEVVEENKNYDYEIVSPMVGTFYRSEERRVGKE